MQKKIRLLAIVTICIFSLIALVAVGFFYYRRNTNLPVTAIPVTETPKTLSLTKLLTAEGFKIDGVPFESQGIIQASISGTVVLFSSSKDLKTQVKALQLLEARIKMEQVKPREIDLRFQKVVLRY